MRAREVVISELVQQWLYKAEADFGLAGHLVSEERYLNAVGFNSQQAAEKFLKAFLVQHQVEFAKTHEIGKILDLVALVDDSVARCLRGANALTRYGVEPRYPSDLPELSLADAEAAVAHAARVRTAIYAALGEPVPPA